MVQCLRSWHSYKASQISRIFGAFDPSTTTSKSHDAYMGLFMFSTGYFSKHNHLVVSTLNETHLFQISDQGTNTSFRRVENMPYSGFVTKKPTLAFSNFYRRLEGQYVDSSLVVQVVPSGAFLLEWDATMGNYMERSAWKVENARSYDARPVEIVAASINGSQVALALNGGRRALLCIQNNAPEFKVLIEPYVILFTSAIDLNRLSEQ